MNSAEKKLATAETRVQDARDRLYGCRAEHAATIAEADALDEHIRSAIYTAAEQGETVDVAKERGRLAALRERATLLEPVIAALTDGVRRVETVRDADIAEQFPELAAGVERDAAEIRAQRQEIEARHAAELGVVDAQARELQAAVAWPRGAAAGSGTARQ